MAMRRDWCGQRLMIYVVYGSALTVWPGSIDWRGPAIYNIRCILLRWLCSSYRVRAYWLVWSSGYYNMFYLFISWLGLWPWVIFDGSAWSKVNTAFVLLWLNEPCVLVWGWKYLLPFSLLVVCRCPARGWLSDGLSISRRDANGWVEPCSCVIIVCVIIVSIINCLWFLLYSNGDVIALYFYIYTCN